MNKAILAVGNAEPDDELLSTISMVGLSVSIVCIVLTEIFLQYVK